MNNRINGVEDDQEEEHQHQHQHQQEWHDESQSQSQSQSQMSPSELTCSSSPASASAATAAADSAPASKATMSRFTCDDDDEETIAYSNIHHSNGNEFEDEDGDEDDCENDVANDDEEEDNESNGSNGNNRNNGNNGNNGELHLIPSPPRKRGGPQHQQHQLEENHFRQQMFSSLSAFSPPRNFNPHSHSHSHSHPNAQQQPARNDHNTTKTLDQFFYNQRPKVKYYRIIYRGFVALLNEPESDSKKSGAYVSYGEIIASTRTHELEVKVPLPLPQNHYGEHGNEYDHEHERYSGISSPSRKSNANSKHSSSLSTISPAAAAAADAASAISSSIATLSIGNSSNGSNAHGHLHTHAHGDASSFVTTATSTNNTTLTTSTSSLPIVPSTSFGVIPHQLNQQQQQQHHHHRHRLSPSSPLRRSNNHDPNKNNHSQSHQTLSPQRRRQHHHYHHQQHTTIQIIQVDDVLTGGYAIDALTKGTSHTHHTPRRSNAKNSTSHDYPNNSNNTTATGTSSRCDGSITTITSMTDRSQCSTSNSTGSPAGTSINSNSNGNRNGNSNGNRYNIIPGGIDRGGLRNINMMGLNKTQKGGKYSSGDCDGDGDGDCTSHDPSNNNNDHDHDRDRHHGYLFQSRNGIAIAECIPSPPLLCQPGPFYYRVVSSAPLPILAGPCADAPITRAMALPGTVHEISLRMGSIHGSNGGGSGNNHNNSNNGGNSNNSSPMSSPGRGGGGSTGLEDGIVYLRLSHRRGWIADRRYVLLPSTSPFQESSHHHHHHHGNYNNMSTPSSPRQSPITTRGHRRNGSGGSYFSTSSRRKCIELVMKEVSDYVDVTSFAISDDISLGGTSISSASIATPASVIRTRRRPVRRHNERSRRRGHGHDNKSGMVVLRKASKNKPAAGIEALPSPISDVSLQSNLSNKNRTSSQTNHQLQAQSQNVDKNTKPHAEISSSLSNSDSNIDDNNELKPNVFLLRVTAPNGLKILDAPSFQVNNLIRGQGSTTTMPFMKTYKSTSSEVSVSKSVTASATTINPSSIFHTMNGSSQSDFGRARSWELDASGKKRILPRGALFEASNRMERAGTFAHGSGLIKLTDGTGWAIIPNKEDLLEQYTAYQGGTNNMSENEVSRAYEEVGNAVVLKDNKPLDLRFDFDSSWIRIVQSTGVLVSCTPSSHKEDQRAKHAPSISSAYSSDSSHSRGSIPLDSDASSAVSSVFGAFRPSKRQEVKVDNISVVSASRKKSRIKDKVNLIPCGTCVQVEHWVESKSHPKRQSFVRLFGGQGWVPRTFYGSQYSVDIRPPDVRQGSFWFRVQSVDGMNVRTGPSQRARPIKSSDDLCFRFECGEFLRASEVLTIHGHADVEEKEDNGDLILHPSESFAKLYRNKTTGSSKKGIGRKTQNINKNFVPLSTYTAPGEWVAVHCNGNLYLEECVNPPTIQRDRDGWRYEVVCESGVRIRKGPSFLADFTGSILQRSASILVNEQVIGDGETITWLRLKDGRGFINNIGEQGEIIAKKKTDKKNGGNDASYKLIARLFHPPEVSKSTR